MTPSKRTLDLLHCLAVLPFLDRQTLAIVAGVSVRSAYNGVAELESHGLVDSVKHGTGLVATTRRYSLTAEGLHHLTRREESSVEQLLQHFPVSAQWQRVLLGRLDGVATIYRVAAAAAGLTGLGWFRWYRAHPLDAALVLPGRRVVGLVRLGRSSDRTAFSKRVWRVQQPPHPRVLLVLTPDLVWLRYARDLLSRTPGLAFASLETDAVGAGADDPVWYLPSVSAPGNLRTALSHATPQETMPQVQKRLRASLPNRVSELGPLNHLPDQMLSVVLRPSEKDALDILFDWPWIGAKDLAGVLGITRARVSQLETRLTTLGLVEKFPPTSGKNLAPSDRGLGYLARRDRASLPILRRKWSVAGTEDGRSGGWRGIPGSRSRQLLRNLKHTKSVHSFIAGLCQECRSHGYSLTQLDPPWRAARYFRLGHRRRSAFPDAFFSLAKGGSEWSCFLEWERRAVRPVTMRKRLLPYLRYFASRRVPQDQGGVPLVLIVFEDDLVAANFLGVARRELGRTGVEVPLWVSHRMILEDEGVLGKAWRGIDLGFPKSAFQ